MSEGKLVVDYKEQLRILRERRGAAAIGLVNKQRLEQQKLHKTLLDELAQGPKTVPELSAATGKPSREIFWHLMALKKYNRIIEDKKQGEYVGYRTKN